MASEGTSGRGRVCVWKFVPRKTPLLKQGSREALLLVWFWVFFIALTTKCIARDGICELVTDTNTKDRWQELESFIWQGRKTDNNTVITHLSFIITVETNISRICCDDNVSRKSRKNM